MYVTLYITFNWGFSAFMKVIKKQFEAIYVTSFIKVGIHTHTHTHTHTRVCAKTEWKQNFSQKQI